MERNERGGKIRINLVRKEAVQVSSSAHAPKIKITKITIIIIIIIIIIFIQGAHSPWRFSVGPCKL